MILPDSRPGETISTTVAINSIDDYRLLFSGEACEAARAGFSDPLSALSRPVTRTGIPLGALNRLADYVDGHGDLAPNDKALNTNFRAVRIGLSFHERFSGNRNNLRILVDFIVQEIETAGK
ncbi:hypothetical protein [Paraburkholderia youngii]|uniref:hypothetical protein n=1 Tax=Paraburkholderia youngii TaxID=2782701 RepID=UPI003D1FE0C6